MAKKKTTDATQVAQSKNEELFTLVKDDEQKVHICVGNQCVTKRTFDTFEQADQFIGTKPYELIFNTSAVIFKNMLEYETKNNTKESAKDN